MANIMILFTVSEMMKMIYCIIECAQGRGLSFHITLAAAVMAAPVHLNVSLILHSGWSALVSCSCAIIILRVRVL